MTRTRAADDFPTIRARLEELRRESERVESGVDDLLPEPPARRPGRVDPAPTSARRLRNAAG